MEEKEMIFTPQEAAEYMGVSYRAVLNWIANGTLGCYRIGDGRSIRIGMGHIQKYLQEHEVTNEYERTETEA